MADGTKKPKGWLIAALICFLLALGGCGAFGYGCSQLVGIADDVTDTVPMGEAATFVAADDGKAIVLLSQDTLCEGTDDSGNDIVFDPNVFAIATGIETSTPTIRVAVVRPSMLTATRWRSLIVWKSA